MRIAANLGSRPSAMSDMQTVREDNFPISRGGAMRSNFPPVHASSDGVIRSSDVRAVSLTASLDISTSRESVTRNKDFSSTRVSSLNNRTFLSGMDRPVHAPSYATTGRAGGVHRSIQSREAPVTTNSKNARPSLPTKPLLPAQLSSISRPVQVSSTQMPREFDIPAAGGYQQSHAAPSSLSVRHEKSVSHSEKRLIRSQDKASSLSLQQVLRVGRSRSSGQSAESNHSGGRLALVGSRITHIDTQPIPYTHEIHSLLLSNNFIYSLANIEMFTGVHTLSLANNAIHYLSDLKPLFYPTLPKLQKLSLQGNDVVDMPFYRIYCVGKMTNLQVLDGMPITEQERRQVISPSRLSQQGQQPSLTEFAYGDKQKPGGIFEHAIWQLKILQNTELLNVALTHALHLQRCHQELRMLLGDFASPNISNWAYVGEQFNVSHETAREPSSVHVACHVLCIATVGAVYRWLQIGCLRDIEHYLHQQCRHSHLAAMKRVSPAVKQQILSDCVVSVDHWNTVLDSMFAKLREATKLLLESFEDVVQSAARHGKAVAMSSTVTEARLNKSIDVLQRTLQFQDTCEDEELQLLAFGPMAVPVAQQQKGYSAGSRSREEQLMVQVNAEDSDRSAPPSPPASQPPQGIIITLSPENKKIKNSVVDPIDYLQILGLSGTKPIHTVNQSEKNVTNVILDKTEKDTDQGSIKAIKATSDTVGTRGPSEVSSPSLTALLPPQQVEEQEEIYANSVVHAVVVEAGAPTTGTHALTVGDKGVDAIKTRRGHVIARQQVSKTSLSVSPGKHSHPTAVDASSSKSRKPLNTSSHPDLAHEEVQALIARAEQSVRQQQSLGRSNNDTSETVALPMADSLTEDLLFLWNQCYTTLTQIIHTGLSTSANAASISEIPLEVRLGPAPREMTNLRDSTDNKTMPALKAAIQQSLNNLAQLQRDEYITWHANSILNKHLIQVHDKYSEAAHVVSTKLYNLHQQLQQSVADIRLAHRLVMSSEPILQEVTVARDKLQAVQTKLTVQQQSIEQYKMQRELEIKRKEDYTVALYDTKRKLVKLKQDLASKPTLTYAAKMIAQEEKFMLLESRSLLLMSRVLKHWVWIVRIHRKRVRIFMKKCTIKNRLKSLRRVFRAWAVFSLRRAKARRHISRRSRFWMVCRVWRVWRAVLHSERKLLECRQTHRKIMLQRGVRRWYHFVKQTAPLLRAALSARRARWSHITLQVLFHRWKRYTAKRGWLVVWHGLTSHQANSAIALKWHMKKLFLAWRNVAILSATSLYYTGLGLQDTSMFQLENGTSLLAAKSLTQSPCLANAEPADGNHTDYWGQTSLMSGVNDTSICSTGNFNRTSIGPAYAVSLQNARTVTRRAWNAWMQVRTTTNLYHRSSQKRGIYQLYKHSKIGKQKKVSAWKAVLFERVQQLPVRENTFHSLLQSELQRWGVPEMMSGYGKLLIPSLLASFLTQQISQNTKKQRFALFIFRLFSQKRRTTNRLSQWGSYRRRHKWMVRGWTAFTLNVKRRHHRAAVVALPFLEPYPTQALIVSPGHTSVEVETQSTEGLPAVLSAEQIQERVGRTVDENGSLDNTYDADLVSRKGTEALNSSIVRLNGKWHDRDELRETCLEKLKIEESLETASQWARVRHVRVTLRQWRGYVQRHTRLHRYASKVQKRTCTKLLRCWFAQWRLERLRHTQQRVHEHSHITEPFCDASNELNLADVSAIHIENTKSLPRRRQVTEELSSLERQIASVFVSCKTSKTAFDAFKERRRYLQSCLHEKEKDVEVIQTTIRDEAMSVSALTSEAQNARQAILVLQEECKIIRAMEAAFAMSHTAYVPQAASIPTSYTPYTRTEVPLNASDDTLANQVAPKHAVYGHGTLSKMLAGAVATGKLQPSKSKQITDSNDSRMHAPRTPPRPSTVDAIWDTPTLAQASDDMILNQLLHFGIESPQKLIQESPLLKRLLPTTTDAAAASHTSLVQPNEEYERLQEWQRQAEELHKANRELEEQILSTRRTAAQVTSDAQREKDEIFASAESAQQLALHRRERTLVLEKRLQQLNAEREKAEQQLNNCIVALNDASGNVRRRTDRVDVQIVELDEQLKVAEERLTVAQEKEVQLQQELKEIRTRRAALQQQDADFIGSEPVGVSSTVPAFSPGQGSYSVNSVIAEDTSIQSTTIHSTQRLNRSEVDIELEAIDYLGHHRGILESSRYEVTTSLQSQEEQNHWTYGLSGLGGASVLSVPMAFRSFLTDGPLPPPPPGLATDPFEHFTSENYHNNDRILPEEEGMEVDSVGTHSTEDASIDPGLLSSPGVSFSYDLENLHTSALDMVLGMESPSGKKHASPTNAALFTKDTNADVSVRTAGGLSFFVNMGTSDNPALTSGQDHKVSNAKDKGLDKKLLRTEKPLYIKPPKVPNSKLTFERTNQPKDLSRHAKARVGNSSDAKGRILQPAKGHSPQRFDENISGNIRSTRNGQKNMTKRKAPVEERTTVEETSLPPTELGAAISHLSQRIRRRLELIPDVP